MHGRILFSSLVATTSFALSSDSGAQSISAEVISVADPANSPTALKVLYLGRQENNHHNPTSVFNELTPVFQADDISLTFTDNLGSLTAANLANYDALMMYGNVRSGSTSANQPLVPIIRDYVRNGGSLIGLHVASAAFRFDPRFAELLGGRFKVHSIGQFIPETLPSNNPLVLNLPPLDSFDETYILKDLNPDITVLQERVQGDARYPWTWVRTEGAGRVFYTASGHVPASGSTATYNSIIQEAFPDLVQRGTHWATRRHFSSFTASGLSTSGKVVGHGSLRVPDTGSYWVSDSTGPEIFAAEAQSISLGGETFHFEVITTPALIPCPGGQESVVFARNILNDLDESFLGIWSTDQSLVVSPLLIEGQPLSQTDPNITIQSLNPEIGTGFAANGAGQLLTRAVLKNETTGMTESVIFLSGNGVVIRAGDSHPSLPSGVTLADLSDGRLSLNSSQQFVSSLVTSEGNQALAHWDGTNLTLPIVEAQAVTGIPGVSWGEILDLKINSSGEIGAIVKLNGSVTTGSDTALVRISSAGGIPAVVLREGQILSGSAQIGDLAEANFVMTADGTCMLTNTLTGTLVTAQNDSVLLRIGGAVEEVIREGDPLPAINPPAEMGSELGSAHLSLDSSGNLYFKASKTEQGAELQTLFRIERDTVFQVLTENDQIQRGSGDLYIISAIEDLLTGSDDDGLPSQSTGTNVLAATVIASSGHRTLIKLDDLNDLDQDGQPNLLEAGLGSPANNPEIAPEVLPKFRELSGQVYFTHLRPTIAGLPTPQPQKSTGLADWTPVTATAVIWADQSNVPTGFERVGLPVDQSDEQEFFRLAF